MNVVIIKYNAGNTSSVLNALNRLNVQATVSNDADIICKAGKVILPGVGAAGAAMQSLQENGLDKVITSLRQPVLGICLGMQLMCTRSEENDTECLGIFKETVHRFGNDVKVPQMGWNNVSKLRSALFIGIKEDAYMYFVHSYYVPLCAQAIGVTNYSTDYSSALQSDNFYGVQFHPEKSGAVGQQLLKNFLEL